MYDNNEKIIRVVRFVSVWLGIIAIAFIIYHGVYNFLETNEEPEQQETIKKDVTITDTGIAESVDKLYDATVIVEVGNDQKITGWGSGFVYKTDDKYGYILTNHHVIENATRIIVANTKEEEVKGELVGSDEYNDVAVVKVPKESVLKVAEIGKSTDMRLGDTVFAIGTPISIQYKFSVTRGIISGKNRMVQMNSTATNSYFRQVTDSWYINLLQIDASINSGNSGGPLANANGQVIGITNSKLSKTANSSSSIENIGFAIPIEDAMTIANMLETTGKVTRPTIGISQADISSAAMLGLNVDPSTTYGVLVTNVEEGGAAKIAGIQVGDVITKIGNYKIINNKYLKYYLYRYQVGDKVEVTYKRGSKELTATLTLK